MPNVGTGDGTHNISNSCTRSNDYDIDCSSRKDTSTRNSDHKVFYRILHTNASNTAVLGKRSLQLMSPENKSEVKAENENN